CCLVLSSIVSWDRVITTYNLRNKAITKVDFNYLFSLSDSNIPQLLSVMNSAEFRTMEVERLSGNLKENSAIPFTLKYKKQMSSKIRSYLIRYETGWQSRDLVDSEVMPLIKNELYKHCKLVKNAIFYKLLLF